MSTVASVEYKHMTYEECVARWPRLTRLMQWCAILSWGEAGCALRDYRDARAALTGVSPYQTALSDRWQLDELVQWGEDMMRWGGGEAVSHYGGPRKLIAAAVRRRHEQRLWCVR